MPHFYYEHNTHKQKRFIRRTGMVLASIVLVTGGFIGYTIFDSWQRNQSNTNEKTTSAVTKSYVTPTSKVFRTPFFQFQAKKSWLESPDASSNGKYVYHSLRGSLIEHEIIIYVNRAPDKTPITRVLPVNLKTQNTELLPLKISEHCKKSLPLGQQDNGSAGMLVVDDVSMPCSPSSQQFTVAVGLMGGSTNMVLRRPDGSNATYSIYYSNLTSREDGNALLEVAETFQTR